MEVNCVIVWKDKGIEFTTKSVEDNKVMIREGWNPTFTIGDFIPERITKRWFQFWRRASGRSYLVFLEDYEEAVIPSAGKFDKYWSKEEAQKHVAKQVSLSRDQQKPFSNWQVVGLMIAIFTAPVLGAFLTKIILGV